MAACLEPTTPPSPDSSDAIHARRRADPVGMRRIRLRTESLFAGANEIEIQHGEAVYRLRITSLGKLILTK